MTCSHNFKKIEHYFTLFSRAYFLFSLMVYDFLYGIQFFFLYMCTPFLAIREENMRDMVTALFLSIYHFLFSFEIFFLFTSL
jgi:hypothetical protein